MIIGFIELRVGLQGLSEQYGVTLNTILQTAWGLLLGRYNDSEDVVFGSVVSGRPAELVGVEGMVGLFINTIPVRIQYSAGEELGELLKRVQENAIAGTPHHYNPLSEIQQLSGTSLLDHIMVFENYPISKEIEGSAQAKEASFEVVGTQIFEQTNYNLTIVVGPGEEFSISFSYNSKVYHEATIERLKGHYEQIIKQICEKDKQAVKRLGVFEVE